MKTYTVYAVVTMNGYVYIGKTTNFKRRKLQHLRRPANDIIKGEVETFGKESLIIEVLESGVDSQKAKRLERDHILSVPQKYCTNRQLPLCT